MVSKWIRIFWIVKNYYFFGKNQSWGDTMIKFIGKKRCLQEAKNLNETKLQNIEFSSLKLRGKSETFRGLFFQGNIGQRSSTQDTALCDRRSTMPRFCGKRPSGGWSEKRAGQGLCEFSENFTLTVVVNHLLFPEEQYGEEKQRAITTQGDMSFQGLKNFLKWHICTQGSTFRIIWKR